MTWIPAAALDSHERPDYRDRMFRDAVKSHEGRRNRRRARLLARRPLFAGLALSKLTPFGLTLFGLTLFGLALFGPALAQDGPVDAPVRVVATVGMVGDTAATIGGACTDVVSLMGPGVDPHLYQATSGDVRQLSRADLILYGGLTLEGQLGDVLERLGERTSTLAVSEAGVPAERRIRVSSAYGVDPHVWMDVSLWAGTLEPIAAALAELAPGCAEGVRERAAAHDAELGALHDWIDEAVATVPEANRVLVTAHDAFAYYGRAYGLDVVGIQGVSTDAEPSIADIRGTAETIARSGVPAVFIETTINPRTIQAVLDATADMGASVELGGTLYSDAMGEPGTAEGTYIGMLHANTVAIVGALGGEVPPLPSALHAWADRYGIADRTAP
ncbi:MAG: zinc ABC transporter substrate-binding protein [Trueperaceae bacterium]|nr:zinc ABC transporter substrate-binding protein [Trueperaceae bacterium]